jgi:hypothetical protein
MEKAKTETSMKGNARRSITQTAGITDGRARTERGLASGNLRSGAVDAIKAATKCNQAKPP